VSDAAKPELFIDSSALFAGVASSTGAGRALLQLGEAWAVAITVSEQVVTETERSLARRAPAALPFFRQTLRASHIRIVNDPAPAEVQAARGFIAHEADVPILVAAMKVKTGFLVTLNRRHFIEDPLVAQRSGLRIGTPGDALAWVRSKLLSAR
jgi:hypothetical protein